MDRGGQLTDRGGSVVFGSLAPAGSRLASSLPSRFAKIVPKSATPIEPPTWRKRVEPLVATPSSRVVDGVLHREDEHLHHHAEPEPEHDHVRGRDPSGELSPRGARAGTWPTVIIAVPTIGNGR